MQTTIFICEYPLFEVSPLLGGPTLLDLDSSSESEMSSEYHRKRNGANGRPGRGAKKLWLERTGGHVLFDKNTTTMGTSVKCCAWTTKHRSS